MSRLRQLAGSNDEICYLGQYDNEQVSHVTCRGWSQFLTFPELESP